MAKSKSSKLGAGSLIRVNDGVTMPEFPQIAIAGWTGSVIESQGRGADIKYIVEWDSVTCSRMPADYVAHCEQHGLTAQMACLKGTDLSPQTAD